VLSLNSNNLPEIKTNQDLLLQAITNLNRAIANLGTNGFFSNGKFTNSAYAGNGYYLTSLNGTNINPGTLRTNNLSAATLAWLMGLAAGKFPSITDDGAGHVGLNNASPGYALDAEGNGYITARLTGDEQNRAAFLFGSQDHGVQYEFGVDASFSGGHDFYIYDSAYGGFILQIDGSHNTTFGGAINCDGGNFYSDGSGNVAAQSFTPVSDRALKENIKPFAPARALDMALALTNAEWRFKGRTNVVTRANRSSATNVTAVATNQVARIIPASGRQFGPMAQDWHQVTGLDDGHHISLTAMNGLLLGAVQGLNQKLTADEQFPRIPVYTPPHSVSSTFGYGAGLLACDSNNLYVSIGTNIWSRINLQTNTW